MTESSKLFERYLNLLGINKSKPDFDFLIRIVKAHLVKVPFENISKLLYNKKGMKNIPRLPEYLDGIEKYNFGGTCYVNNYYLYLLLQHLGFEIKLCGADMKKPDVHLISIVTVEKKEFIIDCGYAAPFFEPLPKDLKVDYIINFGNERYIVKPKDEKGVTKVEQYLNNELQHWYTAKPQPRKIEEFKKVIKDSYSDDAVFMNAIRITKFTGTESLVLKNLQYIEVSGKNSSSLQLRIDEIPEFVEKIFGMPANLVREAAGTIKELKNIYD
jgi:arylamine N-acetyltransferase